MTILDGFQIFLFILLLIILSPLLGHYMAQIFLDQKNFMHSLLGWLEKLSLTLCKINPSQRMSWSVYLKSLLIFNFFGFAALFILLITQFYLPFNPQQFPGISWDLAFNIAASFVTNTDWQSYAGETTLSYLVQMMGLGVQNFLSAATGFAMVIALIRGIIKKGSDTIGNFWQDLIRSFVYILLPLAFILALLLVGEGVIQNFLPYLELTTLEGEKQIIPMGPVASQVAIKQIGTNGGGFFNANSAHPFENPSRWSNFLEMFAIVLIPSASVYMYGILVGSKKHAWLLFSVMLFLWIIGFVIALYAQLLHNSTLDAYPMLEGIETRFGIPTSIMWSTLTTATSNGSVNGMISSLSPLAGGVALFNIMLGEVIFGGVGVGLASIIMYTILTVFLCGLMVGRTPEYLGKKIERREIQWVIAAILIPPSLILIGAGVSSVIPTALSSLSTSGPHGLTEILYTFSSAAGNNGSSFAGINANTPYYNLLLGIIMLIGRLAIIIPSLALAGLFAKKKFIPYTIGTFSTETALFAIMLFFVILLIGALSFFPALSLGPIVEHLLMLDGKSF
jgi:potassium-transporting ATPase potassium-binding subunit